MQQSQKILCCEGATKGIARKTCDRSSWCGSKSGSSVSQQGIVVSKFTHLFKGLGCMKGTYHIIVIYLKENAVPFALTILCRVLIAMMSKVQYELQQMEKKKVFSSKGTN